MYIYINKHNFSSYILTINTFNFCALFQIITVHYGEMTEIIVTSNTRCRENMVFKIEDRGPVSSIKMSLNCQILTMMRTTLSVVS